MTPLVPGKFDGGDNNDETGITRAIGLRSQVVDSAVFG
jgi:hypothetical protein